MTPSISYASAPFEIRENFAESHQRFWDRLARPGAWWDSERRLDIARESRAATTCQLCAQRKAALSPNGVTGAHDRATDLPDSAIEAIHRIRTDPGRLTRSWFDSVVGESLSVEQYVEIVGTLVALTSIDSFCRGVGLELNELPSAQPGDPNGYRPEAAATEESWVPMIPADANLGAEADLWPIGRTGNVIRAMSLVPDEVRTLGDLGAVHYLPNIDVGNPEARPEHLDRPQTELIAARVSALNQCFY